MLDPSHHNSCFNCCTFLLMFPTSLYTEHCSQNDSFKMKARSCCPNSTERPPVLFPAPQCKSRPYGAFETSFDHCSPRRPFTHSNALGLACLFLAHTKHPCCRVCNPLPTLVTIQPCFSLLWGLTCFTALLAPKSRSQPLIYIGHKTCIQIHHTDNKT